MFDISALKEMKLAELQEIAKSAKTIKVTGAKKDTLIAQILEHQDKGSSEEKPKTPDMNNSELAKQKPVDNKAKRTRIAPEVKQPAETVQNDLFAEPLAEKAEPGNNEQTEEKPAFQSKNPKFKKPVFEKKNTNAPQITSEEQPTDEAPESKW